MIRGAGGRRCWAVVPAAGRGERFAATGKPKQYAMLLGRPLIEWTLRRLLDDPRIAAVVAVVAREDSAWAPVAARFGTPRLRSTWGGASRQDSVRAGLADLGQLAADDDWVFVHDAARPCLTQTELDALAAALAGGADGAVLAVPLVDTIKRERAGGIEATVDRSGLWRALTPQVFAFGALCAALDAAARSGVMVTDEAQAMELQGHAPALVRGSPFNIKVTLPEDLAAAARILQTAEATTMRIGQGFDVHAFGAGDSVVLGGVRIAHVRGVVAHSDGDVIIHALCDAVLGAVGAGDIGQHFPDSDPRYRGADSRVFLREVAARMRAAGLGLVNADVTVLAEAPRIAKHRLEMAANLAADLDVAADRINVKATTTEHLGSIGRGEGLAAFATVLLETRQARSST